MAEIITCPACLRTLHVPESFYGQKVQCPQCQHLFVADPHATSVQTAVPLPAPTSYAKKSEPGPRNEDDEYDVLDVANARRDWELAHRGGMIIALGIIAVVICPYATPICGPMAWYMGNTDLAHMRAGRMDPSGEGMVQAGRIIGMISTIMVLGTLALACFGFAVAFLVNHR